MRAIILSKEEHTNRVVKGNLGADDEADVWLSSTGGSFTVVDCRSGFERRILEIFGLKAQFSAPNRTGGIYHMVVLEHEPQEVYNLLSQPDV